MTVKKICKYCFASQQLDTEHECINHHDEKILRWFTEDHIASKEDVWNHCQSYKFKKGKKST